MLHRTVRFGYLKVRWSLHIYRGFGRAYQKLMLRRIIYFLLVTILLGGFGGLVAFYAFDFKPKFLQAVIMGAPKPTETVSAEQAREDRWQPEITAVGTLVSVNGIDITPQVGGIVKALYFDDSGQYVEKGTKLVELDTDTEMADLKNYEAQLKNAEATLERHKKVFAKGFVAQAEVDAAQAQRDALAASIERVKALIAQKTIYAPWAGRLGFRKVDVGKYIAPGQPIVWIQSIDPIYADFPVPEVQFGAIKKGEPVELELPAYPGQVYRGEILSTDAKMSEGSRAITVRAKIDNPDHRLLPGMYAAVTVLAGAPEPVVTVPQTAVSYSLYGNSVYVVVPAKEPDPNAKEQELEVERRFVKAGEVRDGRVRIAEGVKPGEQVVIAGQNKIEPGSKVRIDNSIALVEPQNKAME
jgi:membrane fusion protein (multidrug efflux system)